MYTLSGMMFILDSLNPQNTKCSKNEHFEGYKNLSLY